MSHIRNSSKILKIKYPIITSYSTDAHMVAILNTYPNTEEWLYNNYINLWGEFNEKNNPFIRFNSWNIRKACPYFNIKYLDKKLFDENITEFLISQIDSGNYLNILYDQFYIPNCTIYMRFHNEHQMLIYGYDRKCEIFYIADFFKNSKYSFETVSFKCIENAILSTIDIEDFSQVSNSIQFHNSDYKFSTYFLINSLNNLLYSKNTIAKNENVYIRKDELDQIQKGNYTFGIENYNLIKQAMLRMLLNGKVYEDLRAFHVIYDHKVMMCERLNYLKFNGLIDTSNSIIDIYSNIKNICLNNRNLFIKFLLTKNKWLIERIINNIDIIKSIEEKAIYDLISQVSEKNNKIVTYNWTI